MRKVLIVDDDVNICKLLELYFKKASYTVFSAYDGITAVTEAFRIKPDVIILDLMLPGKDGYDVLREIRQKSDVPILMLTARGDTLDKVVGLELGADDYIEKPFEPQELLARVKAVMRRTKANLRASDQASSQKKTAIIHGDLIVDKNSYFVSLAGEEIEMPPRELELLYYLVKNPNRVFTRDHLLENIWGFDYYGESRTVDVHIKRLREKLGTLAQDNWQIKTVWGVGYKFEVKD